MLVLIMFFHWYADFVCQTDWQAKNKSKNWNALFRHVLVYSVIMTIGFVIIATHPIQIPLFLLITFMTHFITDAITSRINARLWASGDSHSFFVSVGFDQFIHFLTLWITLWVFGLFGPSSVLISHFGKLFVPH